eukprot:6211764-Pleurochrysis_carterae.AAC.2
MDAPSPIALTFTFPSTPAPAAESGLTMRSTPASATPAAASPAAAPATSIPSVSTVRALTADEKDHFIISPEQLASVDRKLMETILGRITLPATRPAYRVHCQQSGRSLIRILIATANASSPSARLAKI